MKLLGSLITALALSFSLLVAIPTTANAAYPGSVATSCSYLTPGSVRRHRPYVVGYSARAAGNARPRGMAYFRVFKVKKGRTVLMRVLANRYTGPNFRRKSLGSFPKGSYATQFVFRPADGSVYLPCASGLDRFRVR